MTIGSVLLVLLVVLAQAVRVTGMLVRLLFEFRLVVTWTWTAHWHPVARNLKCQD